MGLKNEVSKWALIMIYSFFHFMYDLDMINSNLVQILWVWIFKSCDRCCVIKGGIKMTQWKLREYSDAKFLSVHFFQAPVFTRDDFAVFGRGYTPARHSWVTWFELNTGWREAFLVFDLNYGYGRQQGQYTQSSIWNSTDQVERND